MKKLLIVGGLLLLAGTSWAGYKASIPVYLNTSIRYAAGNLGAVRNSPDSIQYLYCGVYHSTSWSSPTAYCAARDAAGTYASCSSSNPGIVQVVTAVADETYLGFYWDQYGGCTSVFAYNWSEFEKRN